MIDEVHTRIVASLIAQHRFEFAALRALCVVYRALLDDAGIDCPDDHYAAEALRRYRRIFEDAGYDGDPEQPFELTSTWWVKS